MTERLSVQRILLAVPTLTYASTGEIARRLGVHHLSLVGWLAKMHAEGWIDRELVEFSDGQWHHRRHWVFRRTSMELGAWPDWCLVRPAKDLAGHR